MTEVTLIDGWKIGDTTHETVTLRPPTAFDTLEAFEAAERAVMTPLGFKMLVSDYRVGVEMTLRQIVKIGDFDAPVNAAMLKNISDADFELVVTKAAQLAAAVGGPGVAGIVTDVGRSDPPREGSEKVDPDRGGANRVDAN